MTTATETQPKFRAFEADVAKLLQLMVHSVYSEKDVFLRELISNAADACEKLRYEILQDASLAEGEFQPRVTLVLDPDANQLTVEDNGIGMSADEMAEALGTIARSGTRAFIDRVAASKEGEGSQLIGQFGVGFYSAFMVADRVDVISRRVGSGEASVWSSDGLGTYTVGPADEAEAPPRGTRVRLQLKEDAKDFVDRFKVERAVTSHSGHAPVPIFLKAKPDAEAQQVADGAALWTRPKSDITPEEYADFYRSAAGQYDSPALTLHYRAEGLHEYTVLVFIPQTKPFDLFDRTRGGHMKLYVRRVFITDEAEITPRYLRFVRGLVDSADLPLNVSREMIQNSPVFAAIQKGVTNRILSEMEKLSETDSAAYEKVWEAFGPLLKEGIYEDSARRETLLGLSRFHTTTSPDQWRSLKDYLASMPEAQTAIYYAVGSDLERLAASPQLEGFRARGVEVLLLAEPVDNFWTSAFLQFEGKTLKSVTQGLADLGDIPLVEGEAPPPPSVEVEDFIGYLKSVLGEEVADVRASDRLTESAVCLVASESGMDRELERMLAGSGRLPSKAKPVLEINARHDLVVKLSATPKGSLREDAARLLLDEARIADGETPADPRAFAARLSRVIDQAVSGKRSAPSKRGPRGSA